MILEVISSGIMKRQKITDLWKGNRPFCVSMMGPSPTFLSNKTTLT